MKFYLAAILAFGISLTSFGFANLRTGKSDTVARAINNDVEIIKQRLLDSYLEKDVSAQFSKIPPQATQGSWSDINYADTSIADWTPIKHIERLEIMAISYSRQGDPNYKSEVLLSKIKTGLEFWFSKNPSSANWWWNTIGVQRSLCKVLLLLSSELSPSLLNQGVAKLTDLKTVDPKRATGANLVWYAQQGILKGVLTNNESDIINSAKSIEAEIKVGAAEGIQYDFSFHQHGPLLYVGSYGLQFLHDALFFANILRDTKVAFNPDKIKILSDFMLKGVQYFVRGPVIDYNTNGRAFTRKDPENSSTPLVEVCDYLSNLVPAYKTQYQNIINVVEGKGRQNTLSGNKYFWNSDYMVQQRPNYYFSVKMSSNRTIGTEIGNGENLKGGWLPFGSNYLLKTGLEYKDIFPVWNWSEIPGVTSAAGSLVKVNYRATQLTQQFVSGVSDGVYGAAAMKLNSNGISGNKSWFFFDDEIVALGSNINSTRKDSLVTTVNQTLLNGDVSVMDGKGQRVLTKGKYLLNNVSWVVNDGVGYIFPDKNSAYVSLSDSKGSWSAINAQYDKSPVTKPVFCIYIPQSNSAGGNSYEYIILPKVSGNDYLNSYTTDKPVKIISNNSKVQAVTESKLMVTEMVFYQAAEQIINKNFSIRVSSPCLVLIREYNDHLELAVSTPYFRNTNITVDVLRANKKYSIPFTYKDVNVNGVTVIKEIAY